MELLAGSDYHLTLSAIGGPTAITVESQPVEQLGEAKSSSLTQNPDSGLWSGLVSFDIGGIYQLTAKSLDGAGNRTSRVLLTVTVAPAGKVIEQASGKALGGATLALYCFEPSTQTWQLWNGVPYDQVNPQRTRADGSYSLVVPKGRYYLQVRAGDHFTFTSDRFDATRALSLASVLSLRLRPHVSLGSFKLAVPDLAWQSQPLPPVRLRPIAGSTQTALVGSRLPSFHLPALAGGTKRAFNLEGRPTVLTLLTTWSPTSQDQLASLAAAQSNHDVAIVPLFSQEHETLVKVYLATAGYHLDGLIDPDGLLVPELQIASVPQHIFMDRSGRIKKVMLGVLSKDELLDQLGRL
jgi:hypothetical protein